MATTSKKFAARTNDRSVHRVLDARTKAILNAVLSEQQGNALAAYLRTKETKRR